jgi:hypothetical protein
MKPKIKKSLKLFIITVPALLTLSLSGMALADTLAAQCKNGNASACLKNSSGFNTIYTDLTTGLTLLAAGVGLVATIMLVVGGIQYITSNGNPQAVTAAKKKIGDVVLGLMAFAFLYAFLQWLIPGGIFNG